MQKITSKNNNNLAIECTKIARFSAAAAAISTAPPIKSRDFLRPQDARFLCEENR